MKLQRQISRTVGESEYSKWVIIIPSAQIEELRWNEGDGLESFVKGNILLIKPMTNTKDKPKKMAYEEFRDKVVGVLKSEIQGLTWSSIKEKLSLPQKVPNNLWVRLMEKDVGLKREKDKQGKTIWRLV